MNKFKHILAVTSIAAVSLISFGVEAASIPTKVQYSTTGTGNGSDGSYDITGVNSFDNQDDSTLLIEQSLVSASNGATTLGGFFSSAVAGDTVVMSIHYQSRLTGFTTDTGSAAPAGFEVTSVLSGTETAVVVDVSGGQVLIKFTDISGTYTLYHDAAPDSDLIAGTGFDNGVQILTGSLGLSSIGGTFTADATGAGNGSTFLSNTITSYNDAYLQADPDANAPLIGTSIDTTINLDFGVATPIVDGGTIGIAGYTVLAGDLKLAADATFDFQGTSVPEPSALFLLGGGLMLMGGMRKKS